MRVTVLSLILFAPFGGLFTSTSGQEPELPVITIPAKELLNRVVLVGQLGEPVGKPITISGTWKGPGQHKDPGPWLQVDTVNGKPLADKVEFQVSLVVPFRRQNRGERSAATGQWTWRITNAKGESVPIPQVGDRWELRGVEIPVYDFVSAEAQREADPQDEARLQQSPSWSGEFQSEFQSFAIQAVKQDN